MCTLILGRDVVSPGSVVLAANRDEDPARPADAPGVLLEHPRLVGGRDRRSLGTWLAVREGRAVVALLNRRDPAGASGAPSPGLRSRGLLVLEVAGVTGMRDAALSRAALARALAAAAASRYAPCTLLFAAPEECWLLAIEAEREPRVEMIAAGWHVITHADLDDVREPRTAGLLRCLSGFRPGSRAEAESRTDALLRSHGEGDLPPVCLHAGRMVTVSASSVWLAPGEARYRHAEGPPCLHPLTDHSHLLAPPAASVGSA